MTGLDPAAQLVGCDARLTIVEVFQEGQEQSGSGVGSALMFGRGTTTIRTVQELLPALAGCLAINRVETHWQYRSCGATQSLRNELSP